VQHVWPWVDALVYSIIPFVAILVLNILIMRQVSYIHQYCATAAINRLLFCKQVGKCGYIAARPKAS